MRDFLCRDGLDMVTLSKPVSSSVIEMITTFSDSLSHAHQQLEQQQQSIKRNETFSNVD
jgi:hypothetical protein